jgi:hypothetical protein
MATPAGASFQIHPNRSKAACSQRSASWLGMLVSDGSLVYQCWQGLRQRCVAHRIRTAKGRAEPLDTGSAGCGQKIRAE